MGSRTIFERNGFVALSSFYREEELLNIEDELERFIAERIPVLPPEHFFLRTKVISLA